MNYKLEKFWNPTRFKWYGVYEAMNYKLEKFWNNDNIAKVFLSLKWTINLKSFEISI